MAEKGSTRSFYGFNAIADRHFDLASSDGTGKHLVCNLDCLGKFDDPTGKYDNYVLYHRVPTKYLIPNGASRLRKIITRTWRIFIVYSELKAANTDLCPILHQGT